VYNDGLFFTSFLMKCNVFCRFGFLFGNNTTEERAQQQISILRLGICVVSGAAAPL
jgi:hypothetical protein